METTGKMFVVFSATLSLFLLSGVATAQDDMEEVEEVIVVTASRTEQVLHEVPAAVTVLQAAQIEQIPADDFGDLLRNVPGMNVTQLGARDINMKTRGATGTLETGQLVLLDGRSIYLDFFGFVMWDFMPVNTSDIKQIEIVRGPGGAVWGANAMGGVVNVITKSPREMVGTSLKLGAGELGTTIAGITVAAVSDRVGYKVSAGYYEQDPYDRPTGTIPGTIGPANPNGTQYPEFENKGTEQPKFDLRFDYDKDQSTTWRFAGGYAGTDGLVHSGLGPFDIDGTATMSYAKIDWNRMAAQISIYGNFLDGDSTNLLAFDTTGQPLKMGFVSDTYNLQFSNTTVARDNHIINYGGNVRTSDFELTIAPGGDKRDEWGIYLQDEILIGNKVRWVIGGRYDDIDPIGGIFTPRTSLVYSPSPNNSFRVSYNEAFRSPSLINSYLEITIVNLVCFAALPDGTCLLPYIFPSFAGGDVDVKEERLEAFEVGWVGTFGPSTVTLSIYENETTDAIDFFTASTYTAAMPPPNFPLPPFLLDVPPALGGLQGLLPATFSYRNTGTITDTGVEFSYSYNPRNAWSFFFNGSWQDEPETKDIDMEPLPNGTLIVPVNQPPDFRFNGGFASHHQLRRQRANVRF